MINKVVLQQQQLPLYLLLHYLEDEPGITYISITSTLSKPYNLYLYTGAMMRDLTVEQLTIPAW